MDADAKHLHILFGFKAAGTQQKILTFLKSFGYETQSNARFTKPLILDYVRHNKECDTVVLKEYLDGGGKYEADELAELTEESDINVIVVLDSYHRGREYMKTLLDAGITCAIFPEYRDSVNPEELAKLASRKRTRREARYYYRIQNLRVNMETLNYEQFSEYYQYLIDESHGINGTDRFMTIMQWLTPARASYFIKNLPEEILMQLRTTSEFYDVLDELRKKGFYPIGNMGKRPKKLSKGIPEDSFREKTLAQFGAPPDITVRTMNAEKNMDEDILEDPPSEAVELSRTEYVQEEEAIKDTEDSLDEKVLQEDTKSEQPDPKKLKELADMLSGMDLDQISKVLAEG